MSSSNPAMIGGVFGLEPASPIEHNQSPPFAGLFTQYFLSARCAIYAVCQSLKPRVVWLPSYICTAVLDPFRSLEVPVRYYDAGPNIKSRTDEWIADVRAGDLVLVIHYFGFANTTFPAADLKDRGAVIIEDASQGLFMRQLYAESICSVYSPRKFLGVPDGGVLATSRADEIRCPPLEGPPEEWWKSAFALVQMRRDFDRAGGENRWFPLFRRVEEAFPVGLYRSSEIAETLIKTKTDYEYIKNARRKNYQALAERLREFALFPVLHDETVPLGFPVCLDVGRRDAVLECLYSQQIYPPVHWCIEGVVPKDHQESHSLSQRILTLICDQRYTISDMARQSNAFLSAVN